MRTKRTLAVRFSEPSGLLAYSAAPARNAAMSMMKPVDNHTTSIGMMEIMGSRTGRFTRNDSVQLISVASTWNGSFLLESGEQKLRPGHGSIVKAQHGGDPETMAPSCRRAGPPSCSAQQRARRMPVAAGHGAPRCRMRRARAESQSDAARRAWLEVSGEDDLAPSRENKELEILFLSS
jgi:hypothetical protein